ncbi:hypothetical protein IWZ01DRAFT_228064 [Phyllosticta capitalensis]
MPVCSPPVGLARFRHTAGQPDNKMPSSCLAQASPAWPWKPASRGPKSLLHHCPKRHACLTPFPSPKAINTSVRPDRLLVSSPSNPHSARQLPSTTSINLFALTQAPHLSASSTKQPTTQQHHQQCLPPLTCRLALALLPPGLFLLFPRTKSFALRGFSFHFLTLLSASLAIHITAFRHSDLFAILEQQRTSFDSTSGVSANVIYAADPGQSFLSPWPHQP